MATTVGRTEWDPRETRGVTYCIVPRDLAPKLHERLHEHFRSDPSIRVVVEFRDRDRRHGSRRAVPHDTPQPAERRKVRNVEGRRVADRRASTLSVAPPALPRQSRRYADRLTFVERFEPTAQRERDIVSARLVTRIQAGDQDAFAELYLTNFDAVYTYLRISLKDYHEAEDAAQEVFMRALGALPRFEIRPGTPFRAWLFTIARNIVLAQYREQKLLDVEDPQEITDRQTNPGLSEPEALALEWVTDDDLLFLIRRLPAAQRQVLTLRYMLELSTDQIASVLGRSPVAVRKLEHRALRFLEERLIALRRRSSAPGRRTPMLTRLRRAPVLGARRFALASTSTASRGMPG